MSSFGRLKKARKAFALKERENTAEYALHHIEDSTLEKQDAGSLSSFAESGKRASKAQKLKRKSSIQFDVNLSKTVKIEDRLHQHDPLAPADYAHLIAPRKERVSIISDAEIKRLEQPAEMHLYPQQPYPQQQLFQIPSQNAQILMQQQQTQNLQKSMLQFQPFQQPQQQFGFPQYPFYMPNQQVQFMPPQFYSKQTSTPPFVL